MKLQAIEVESFRGFRERQRLEFLGAQVLLLYGPNGHGKTSVFDAIEWALTGEIDRYSEATDERKRSRFVGNLFAKRPPRVTIELIGDDGRRFRVTRIGLSNHNAQTDYGKSSLEVEVDASPPVKGDEANQLLDELMVRDAWKGSVTIDRALSLTHLLGQERMNYILRGMKGKERYDSISLLFGTDFFKRYETMFQETLRNITAIRKKKEVELTEESGILAYLLERQSTLNGQVIGVKHDDHSTLDDLLVKYGELFPFTSTSGDQDLNQIRLVVEQMQEQLRQERNRFEVDQQRPYLLLLETKEAWQEAKAILDSGPDKITRLERLVTLQDNHRILNWLIEQLEDYRKVVQNRTNRQQSINVLSQSTEKCYSVNEQLQKLVDELRMTIRSQVSDPTILLLTCDTAAAHEILTRYKTIDTELWTKLSQTIDLVQVASRNYEISYAEYRQADQRYQEWDQTANQIQTLNEQYRLLLSVVQDYASKIKLIDACPACGTPGITSDHLLAHTQAEQGKLNPQLPLVEESLNNASIELERTKNNWQQMLQQITVRNNAWQQMIQEVECVADEKRKEALRYQTQVSQLQKEIDELDVYWQKYREHLQQFGIYEQDDLETSINQKLIQCAVDWHSHSLGITEEELSNLLGAIAQLNERISKAEVTFAESTGRLQALGMSSTQARCVSTVDVEQFLVNVGFIQKQVVDRLIEHDDIMIKILSAIDRVSKAQDLKGLEKELVTAKKRVDVLHQELSSLDEEMEILKDVIRNVPKAVDQLNEKVVGELFETIRSIYSRINSHPMYRTIHFDKGQRYGSNSLLLTVLTGQQQEEDTSSANPSYIFSTAQVNSIAVSLFLAMALHQQWSPFRLIGMDDPVQSMDDLNVLALIDLIRVLCDSTGFDKQLIISTHDATFYQLMLKKFRFLRVGVIEYEGFDETGPLLRQVENELGMLRPVRLIEPLPKKKLSSDFLAVDMVRPSYERED